MTATRAAPGSSSRTRRFGWRRSRCYDPRMSASGRRLTLVMAAAVLGAGLVGGAGSVAQPEPPSEPAGGHVEPVDAVPLATPSPRNANYAIDVALDHDARTLTGREVLTWRNISPVTTSELRFHLYYNAWRNTRSTWMRERVRGRGLVRHRAPVAPAPTPFRPLWGTCQERWNSFFLLSK